MALNLPNLGDSILEYDIEQTEKINENSATKASNYKIINHLTFSANGPTPSLVPNLSFNVNCESENKKALVNLVVPGYVNRQVASFGIRHNGIDTPVFNSSLTTPSFLSGNTLIPLKKGLNTIAVYVFTQSDGAIFTSVGYSTWSLALTEL